MTELIWDGKYKDGKKTGPLRVALPFQTIETVNESAPERQKTLDLFSSGAPTAWRNRLIWGDKKYVLPSLLPEFAGKVNLIYIDPPFDTGADFSFTATIPDDPDTDEDDATNFIKQPSVLEQKAYRDTWGRGLDSYLQWFYDTAVILRELMTESGSFFLHIDYHIGHYAKVVLDEVFGADAFQNEVIWQRTDAHNDARSRFGNIHDALYWFSKSRKPEYFHDAVRTPLSPAGLAEYSLLELPNGEVVSFAGNEDKLGRRLKLDDATWRGTNPAKKFIWRGAKPSSTREWMYGSVREMDDALRRGELYLRDPKKGSARCKKSYLDENKGILLQDIWTDAGRMKGGSRYATEKPEPLLERLIKATTQEGDLILDCFCGSGTTAAVAEKFRRRWIACDLGRFAIHTTRKRLLQIPNLKPFVVQNLGKYERQAWQGDEFASGQTQKEREVRYRKFILDLYKAEPLTGNLWLHGLKNGRAVHVGAVDAPVTLADVKAVAAEVWKSVGKGKESARKPAADVLGWEFAFEVNELAKQVAAEARVDVVFKKIPREVLEKKAVEQGDIKFFELASVGVEADKKGREVKLTLTDFVIPPDDVPEEARKAITHWSQWVDYWAVDWDYKGDTFHNQWQSFRTRKETVLQTSTSYAYDRAGEFTIVVKVIDILGNDTTKPLKVAVK